MSKFKQWMNGEVDLFNKELEPYEKDQETLEKLDENRINESITSEERKEIINKEIYTYKRSHLILSIITFALYVFILIMMTTHLQKFGYTNEAWNYVSRYYIDNALKDTKSVNSITGMILDYRAFDTLGESFVLFTAVTCVSVLLTGFRDDNKHHKHPFVTHKDPIVHCMGFIFVPIIFLFGIYVILNGHLSPGGGFSGGAIIGAGLILSSLAFGADIVDKFFTLKTFKTISAIALSGYAITKCYSFFMGGMGIHDPILEWFHSFADGSIISGGYILILNICVGSVVACTMYGFYSLFRKGAI